MLGKNQSTSTIIDSSARLDGKFSSQADLVVKGRMDGTIESTKNVEITESAKVKTKVKANNIVVAGKVEGNIEAVEKLDITKTGKITGEIKCKALSIEPGAKLVGNCVMPLEKPSVKEKKPSEKQVKICPQCQAPMRYIFKYQRWYCDHCKEYERLVSQESKEQHKEPKKKEEKREKKKTYYFKIIKGFFGFARKKEKEEAEKKGGFFPY